MASRRSNPASIYHLAPGQRWVTSVPGVEITVAGMAHGQEVRHVYFHGELIGDVVSVKAGGWRTAGSRRHDGVPIAEAIGHLLGKRGDRSAPVGPFDHMLGASRRRGIRPTSPGHVDFDIRRTRRVDSSDRRVEYAPGEIHRIRVPYSEVAMHMGIAGKVMPVKLSADGRSAQLYHQGRKFSFPVLPGEAGIRITDYGTRTDGHGAPGLHGIAEAPGALRRKRKATSGRTASRAARRAGRR